MTTRMTTYILIVEIVQYHRSKKNGNQPMSEPSCKAASTPRLRRMFENSFNNIDRAMRNDEGLASELDYAEQTVRRQII